MIKNFYISKPWVNEYVTYMEKIVTEGHTKPTYDYAAKINRLIRDLKDAGLWSTIDLLYLFAHNGDIDSKRINLKNPSAHKSTFVGTFSDNSLGVAGDGTAAYCNPSFIMDTNLVNASRLNVARWCWVETAFSAGSAIIDGNETAGYNSMTNSSSNIQRVSSQNALGTNIDLSGTGFKMLNRADGTQITGYSNLDAGQVVAHTTTTDPATAHYLWRRRQNVSTYQYSNHRLSIYGVSAHMGAVRTQLYNILNTYRS